MIPGIKGESVLSLLEEVEFAMIDLTLTNKLSDYLHPGRTLSRTLNQRSLDILRLVESCRQPGTDKRAWAQWGTRADQDLKDLEELGYVESCGGTANGSFWRLTGIGHEAILDSEGDKQ